MDAFSTFGTQDERDPMSQHTAQDIDGTIAVLVPCYNEAITIAKVVDDFKRVLPQADIYVYDNNSSDDTGRIAREHGAIVRKESTPTTTSWSTGTTPIPPSSRWICSCRWSTTRRT